MKIWKYTLEAVDNQQLEMPAGARILSLQLQHGSAQIWALVDDTPVTPVTELRVFLTYRTGHDGVSRFEKYVGTYQRDRLVFHVFELMSTSEAAGREE